MGDLDHAGVLYCTVLYCTVVYCTVLHLDHAGVPHGDGAGGEAEEDAGGDDDSAAALHHHAQGGHVGEGGGVQQEELHVVHTNLEVGIFSTAANESSSKFSQSRRRPPLWPV